MRIMLFNAKLVALLLVVFACPFTAFSENRGGAITVSPTIGYYHFDNDQPWRDTKIYTLGLGYNFTEHWQMEASAAVADDVYSRVGGPHIPDMFFLKTDILYHLNPSDLSVFYLAGGFGRWSVNPSSGYSFSEEFVNYGAGMKIDVFPELPVRIDVRHVLFWSETMQDKRNVTYSIGINSQFGGVKPKSADTDADNDGIIDSLDRCPATPLGTPVNTVGCPLVSDAEAVTPADDDHRPATSAGRVDNEPVSVAEDVAVPAPVNAVATAPVVPVMKKAVPQPAVIRFQPGSNGVQERDREMLKNIAEYLNENPQKSLRVEGHTDSIGAAGINQRLSQERAEKVRQQLIDVFNIAPERIRAIGFGEGKPLEDNSTQFGRQINRRVEIILE
ncbi:MAG: OmpA family protein [Desulfuromonadales bacterium]|nr:OmpA family protein [Desulfuromonadales bacterium]